MQTLKHLYEKSLVEKQDNAKQLLYEAIDQHTIDEMQQALKKISDVLNKPEAESLSSFQFGLQKAHKELSNVLAMGAVRSWAHAMLPAGATAVGRLAAFTYGVTQLFKQLVPIVNLVKGSIDGERQAEWDPNVAVGALLDSDATARLSKILIKAMSPPGGLSYLTAGLPYVKDETAAAEILELSYNELTELSKSVQQIKVVKQLTAAEMQDVENVVRRMRAAADKPDTQKMDKPDTQKMDKPDTQKMDKQEHEQEQKSDTQLVLPQEKNKPNVARGEGTPKVTVREFETEIDAIYDDVVVRTWGEKGMALKQLKELKPKLVRALLVHMSKKGLLYRQTRE